MQIVKPSAEIIRPEDFSSPYEFIEKVGRVCYKSEDKITSGSSVQFLRNLRKRKHLSVLEHYNIFFRITDEAYWNLMHMYKNGYNSWLKYVHVIPYRTSTDVLIAGSFRAFMELFGKNYRLMGTPNRTLMCMDQLARGAYSLLFDYSVTEFPDWKNTKGLEIVSRKDVKEGIEKGDFLSSDASEVLTHTIHFTCDRGVSHELVRHRPCAISQESTRYCNYGHEGDITVIEPLFFGKATVAREEWEKSCAYAEKAYMSLLAGGSSPQEARSVLPNSLKTEVVMTATEAQWKHFFNLRYAGATGAPHPQMKELTSLIIDEMMEETVGRIA